jgi:hypothetical protein
MDASLMALKVFYSVSNEALFSAASLIVAENEEAAESLLRETLTKQGIENGSFTLEELDLEAPHALVLIPA